jgi:hypothetical protein
MAQLLHKLFHWKTLLCLEKERLNIPTMLVDFFIGARALSANSGSVHPNTRRVWNFCDFGLKRKHLIFADFVPAVWKSRRRKKNCISGSNNWSDEGQNLYNKFQWPIFCSLEMSLKLYLWHTPTLSTSKMVVHNWYNEFCQMTHPLAVM